VTWAHWCILQGDQKGTIQALWYTVILGVLFTICQAYEYTHAGFGFKDGVYASTFYMATGFHGFHVIVGTIFLAVCLVRAYKNHFTPNQHLGFEFAAWYWHFVDVVWLFLFICVYIDFMNKPGVLEFLLWGSIGMMVIMLAVGVRMGLKFINSRDFDKIAHYH
jgi:cytochrome c oxidase subunit 3